MDRFNVNTFRPGMSCILKIRSIFSFCSSDLCGYNKFGIILREVALKFSIVIGFGSKFYKVVHTSEFPRKTEHADFGAF